MNKCIICQGKMLLYYEILFDDRYGAPGSYAIYKCNGCGYMTTVPSLKKNEIGMFYNKFYPMSKLSSKDVLKQINTKNKLLMWLEGINNTSHHYVTQNNDVLDIGSANGVSLLEIKGQGARAFGVEPDPHAKKIAKELGLNVFTGFITGNPFKGRKFDYITASQVIEHEPDPNKFLKALRSRLKNNGKIILSFPNNGSFYQYIFGIRWIHWHVPYHINHFSKKSFLILAKKNGLKVTKLKTITPNLWTLLQIRSLFYKPIIGKPSPVWTKLKNKKAKKNNKNYVSALLNTVLPKLFLILIIPINRFIDLLGLGESFLVFLDKNE